MMKKITTLEQIKVCSDDNLTLTAPEWKGGIQKPASWFLEMRARNLLAVLSSGLFIEEAVSCFGPVTLMTHDTSTELLIGTKQSGFIVGEKYQCVGERAMDGYDYVLLIGPGEKEVWAGADQVHKS